MSEYIVQNTASRRLRFHIEGAEVSIEAGDTLDLETRFTRNQILAARHLRTLIAQGLITISSIVDDANTVRMHVTP